MTDGAFVGFIGDPYLLPNMLAENKKNSMGNKFLDFCGLFFQDVCQ